MAFCGFVAAMIVIPFNACRRSTGAGAAGDARYDGPAVAERAPHYHFRLAALDVPRLELGEAAKAEAVCASARPATLPL
jgi:phosphatidylethanolamine-binding protein (PEBP) family uncharacterized protein